MIQNLIIIFLIFFINCNPNNSSTVLNSQNSVNQTIITSNIYESNFYFDVLNGIETDSLSIWQLSFQKKIISYVCTNDDVNQGEGDCNVTGEIISLISPSLILGDVFAAAYDLNYDELESYPDTFMQDAQIFNNESVEYGGENQIINPGSPINDTVLIIYYLANHSVYKIRFNDYDTGIINFDFQEL